MNDERPNSAAAPQEPAALSPLKRAFLALEDAQSRLAAMERAAREPIAVIGLGCRVPGGGNDAESFWRLMRDGVDAIGPTPADRWDMDALYDPDPEAPGRIATRQGGFLGPVDRFDAGFFGIAPREAQGMDPQQRLLLEVGWEALENAGQAPGQLEGSRTGVYVGVTASDYAYMQLMSGDRSLLDAHFTSGIAHSIFSGRLSYLLGLQGPSLTLDTACSSSLVAVHLACQALRSGECRMALAGGVNLILSPDLYIALSHSRMLAPDGRCKTFDASADGFARGEGCGMVVLKRLSDAQADGDRVLAVIRGSAVNQDGPSSGLTAPNGPAQEAVIREALASAGVAPHQVGLVEAHGTGTQLGDPLEVQALGAVFGKDRDQPLWLASVKTNIGHLEAAAGITGLIKLVLSLQHREIPAHLHFKTPSPHIPWADHALRVPTEHTPWQPIGGRRIAGVSSFGFSGTNAHVVLEEAPEAPALAARPARSAHLMALSARDETALAALAARYAQALRGRDDAELADICFTANVGRSHFAQRATVLAHSVAELCERLDALARGAETEGVKTARVARRDPARVAFLFTGQGAQYAGMAQGLYHSEPVFREALDRCAALLAPHLEQPLLSVLFPADGDSPLLNETAYTQPALFALEYALTEWWRAWGVVPQAVIGHSVGELVAACVAGVFSLEDALRLIAVRGRLMQALPAGGGMAAVFTTEAQAVQAIEPYRGSVSLGAVNGVDQVVISGAQADVDAVCRELAGQGVRTQALTVSHAFHSPLVEPMLDAFEREAAQVRFSRPTVRVVSNLSGALESEAFTRAGYWRQHVREAVRFGDGLQALAALRPDVCIEIGPHPTLLTLASRAWGDSAPALVASLRKGRHDGEQMLEAVGALYLAGAELNWRVGGPGRVVDLPSYPFQRERCWFQAKPTAPLPAVRGRSTGHPLLGTRLRGAGRETVFESRLGADDPAYLREHRVQGHVVVPATAYLDTLLAAARQQFGPGPVAVEDITVQEALLLADDGAARTLQVVCGAAGEGGAVAVTLSSLAEDAPDAEPWVTHVSGTLRAGPAARPAGTLSALKAACAQPVDIAGFYEGFARRGLDFGPGFRSIQSLWQGPSQAVGEVALSGALAPQADAYGMHPVLLDGCLQVLAAALPTEGEEGLYLPIGIGRFVLHGAPGARCWSHVNVLASSPESSRATVTVWQADGTLVAELADVQLKRVSRDALARLGERWLDDCLYETVWCAAPPLAQGSAPTAPLAALSAQAMQALPALRQSARLDAYDAFIPQLEALCAEYVVRTLSRLGWAPTVGERAAEAELAVRLGVQARHQRLFGRLLAILGEAGLLARESSGWVVRRALHDAQPGTELARLKAAFPDAAAELEMTGRVAAEMAEALRGEREPMQLLFPGGSLDTAERMYRDAPTAQVFNGLVTEVMLAVVAHQASGGGRPLRILEIGGGTGGTTARVAPRLPAQGVEYTFTDIGPLFVARARERFAAHGFMRFAVLDLEQDPTSQGFDLHSFDVVIAANVIHATADLRRTLDRVRGLLVPGGLLAMLEVTAPQRWFDLTVGLTEGWWAFDDTDLRPDYATLPREAWLSLLAEQGFEERTALPEGGGHQGTLALQSLLLARATALAARCWLLWADEGGVAARLAERLRARGDECLLVRAGERFMAGADGTLTINPASAADHRRVLTEMQAAGRPVHGVVHAWSLDAEPWESLSASQLAAAQTVGAVSGTLLAQALIGLGAPPPLWFATRGAQRAAEGDRALNPAQAPVWGLAKAVALEHPELRCACVDLEEGAEIEALLAELDAPDQGPSAPRQIAWRAGERRMAQLAHQRRASAAARLASYRLAPATRGALDQLGLQPLERRAPGAGEVEIAVEATGLNFKDVLNVLGMYPGDPGPLGGECAGRVSAVGPGVAHLRVGDAVLAVAGGSFASHVIARAAFVQPRPAGLSAEEGASFPIPFVTAEFCLGHLAGMKAGDRVLIHAAAGGVGMAAVRLAQRAGAEVFATAGSEAKRELLRAMGVPHVMDSRSAGFADEVLALTQGRGVDTVLNALSGELIEAGFRALADGGCFIEIGKRGIKTPEWVQALGRGLRYHIVDWGETGERDPALIGGMLARLVAELREGRLAPLPRHVFALEEAERAFRFMAQAQHTGKVVVRHGPAAPAAVRRDGTYLITGGLAGLGPVVAHRLAEQGAGRVVLISRRGVTPEVAPVLDQIRALGTTVVAEAVDVSDADALAALLARLRADGPPLRGVVHSAGVLDDAGLLQQDALRFEHVFAPKVRGGWLLDRLTRSDALDFFVLFSSVAAVLGSRGQANHSAANAFLDLLAHQRQARGLPGLSINWGAWTEVGAAADRQLAQRLAAQGIGALTPPQGLLAFERLLAQGRAQAAVLPIEWPRYLQAMGLAAPPAFLAELAGPGTPTLARAQAGAAAPSAGLREQLQDAPPGRRRPLVAAFVRERALKALGVDPARAVDPRTPLGELGLDSLLAVELRNTLGAALGQTLSATLLFDYPTIDTLTDYLLNDVIQPPAPAAPEAVAVAVEAPASMVDAIEDLSDEEVDRLLAQRAQRKG
jgi:acyl transferase domain-containing protein/acyl carrier protein